MSDFSYLLLQLRDYIATVEAFISSSIDQFPLSSEQREQLLRSPELELEFGVSYEDFMNTMETFPEVLRRSVFLVSFILLETKLNDICDDLRRRHSCPIAVRNLRGSGIRRAAEYIGLLQGVNIKDKPHWPDLCRVQELRNLLVHHSGRLDASRLDASIGRYVQSHPFLSLRPVNLKESPPSAWGVSFEPGFCGSVADLIGSFFDSLEKDGL